MKQFRLLLLLLVLAGLAGEAAAQTKKTVTRRTRVNKVVVKQPEPEPADTMDTKMVIAVTQPSFIDLLSGKWQILNVRKQQKDDLTPLSDGIYIEFKTDSTFMGFAGCNRFHGTYNATGATLFLEKIAATKMACDRLDMENLVLRHLGNTVKSFAAPTYSNPLLALKDGTGSTVFECKRVIEE